jgi:hypothetical protein
MSKFGAGSFGKTIDPNDLKSALDRAKIPHGTNVTNAEIDALLTKAKIAPSSAVVAGYKA